MPENEVPAPGDLAPDFELKGPGGQPVTLSEYRNHKNVVLVFYPLAFSPVCSSQLPDIEQQARRLEQLDAVVLGISVDSHFANDAFARTLGLSFSLLSDWRREVSKAYGVLLSEQGFSKRATFIVDKRGYIVHVDISPALSKIPDLENVIAVLEGLQ